MGRVCVSSCKGCAFVSCTPSFYSECGVLCYL